MVYTKQLGLAFWYEFDRRTQYNPALRPVLVSAGAFGIQDVWHDARSTGQYPAAFDTFVIARTAAWKTLADLQRSTISELIGKDSDALRLALEDFGQGVLVDAHQERIDNDDAVHMMDTGDEPPIGYHRWHAGIRAIQRLDGDALWTTLDQCVALAWAIQSVARPRQQAAANPPLPDAAIAQLRAVWLALDAGRIDRQYDLGSGREGYHPTPTHPVP